MMMMKKNEPHSKHSNVTMGYTNTHTHTCHNGILLFPLGVFSSRFFSLFWCFIHSFIHHLGWIHFCPVVGRSFFPFFSQIDDDDDGNGDSGKLNRHCPFAMNFFFSLVHFLLVFFLSFQSLPLFLILILLFYDQKIYRLSRIIYVIWMKIDNDGHVPMSIPIIIISYMAIVVFFHKFDLIFSSPSIFFINQSTTATTHYFSFQQGCKKK